MLLGHNAERLDFNVSRWRDIGKRVAVHCDGEADVVMAGAKHFDPALQFARLTAATRAVSPT